MNKEEQIQRLKALGEKLGRDVSLAGSKEDLALRIAELEEELSEEDVPAGQAGTDDTTDDNTGNNAGQTGDAVVSSAFASDPASDQLVAVETLTTLHIDALHQTRNEPLVIAVTGTVIRVTAEESARLIDQGLAREH